jgi:alkylation response protein AidB-like acyl-CoA dehydrogenase
MEWALVLIAAGLAGGIGYLCLSPAARSEVQRVWLDMECETQHEGSREW